MFTLYGYPNTRSTRVLWTLEELGFPYEYINVDLFQAQVEGRPLYDLNPANKIPILVDDEFALTESAAICYYLAEKDPAYTLIGGQNIQHHARVLQWCSFAISELEQPLWNNFKHSRLLPEEYRLSGMEDSSRFEFSTALEIAIFGLSDQDFLLGETFSIADIMVGNTLLWARGNKWVKSDPVLDVYIERLLSRPALNRAMKREKLDAA